MSKILVISDNHGETELMMQIIQKERADLIVHAGDHGIPLEFMKAHFNYFVGGNNDYDGEEIQNFVFEGFKFLLVHGHQHWSWDEQKWYEKLRKWGSTNNADVVIFGHSHKEVIDTSEQPYLVNPGSVTWPRNEWMKPSYLIIETSKKKLIFKIKHLTLSKK